MDLRVSRRPLPLSPAFAGNPGDEDSDLIVIRDEWTRQQLRKRSPEFSKRSSLLTRIGTFNVNGKSPTGSLASWVRSKALEDPDMLVFGFQEVDLSTEALLYSTTPLREEAWCEAIETGLGESEEKYMKLASKQLVGILMIIYIRKSLRPNVSDIKSTSAGIGIMNTLGNKGGVAIRFQYHDSALCFVNAHLAAFDNMVDKRNADYVELCRRLVFPLLPETPAAAASIADTNVATVFDCDALFWLGDLNYRIDLPDEDVRVLIASEPRDKNLELLLDYDQLAKARRGKKAFEDFNEAPISFLPTYRFDILQRVYDFKRRPAWTDRIMHVASDPDLVQQDSYESHPDIHMSDHKPVSANFTLQVATRDRAQYSQVANEVFKQLSGFESSEERPQVKLSTQNIDLGKVTYKSQKTVTIEISNTGKIAVAFRFLPVEVGQSLCLPCLDIEPKFGLVLPGENLPVRVLLNVNKDSAAFLNSGAIQLEDTLIMHLERGLDHFVAVTGTYSPSCFARSLTELSRFPGPVRSIATENLLSENKALNAPRELLRLVDWLMTNGLDVDDLFLTPADPDLTEVVRECLDTGDEFSPRISTLPQVPDGKSLALAFGDALVQFLDSLTEPVIPERLHARCAQVTSRDEGFEMLGEMPGVSANVWVSLTAFLHFLVTKGPEERIELRANQLAAVFSPVLLRSDPHLEPISPLAKRRFLLHFIS